MHKFFTIQGQLQSIPLRFRCERSRVRTWLTAYRDFLARKKLNRLFASLDPSTLEDIGVPHDPVSLRAGPLDRYPDLIRVKSVRC